MFRKSILALAITAAAAFGASSLAAGSASAHGFHGGGFHGGIHGGFHRDHFRRDYRWWNIGYAPEVEDCYVVRKPIFLRHGRVAGYRTVNVCD